MRLSDILELTDVNERVRRMSRRLIPLCQGEGLLARSAGVQSFFALNLLRGEISNGSFRQYFSNSSGDTWPLARRGLTGSSVAAMFQAALALFPTGEPSLDRAKRLAQLADVDVPLLAALGSRLVEVDAEIVDAMSRLLAAHKDEFAFIDRYPNGFKALSFPVPIDLAELSVDDPFRLITAAFASLHDKGGPRGPIERRFLDVFLLADEVSVAGFESYLFTHAADRHIDALGALRGLALDDTAALLDAAIAMVPGTLADDTVPRRVQLASLPAASRATLELLTRDFQAHRLPLAVALARYVSAHLSVFAA